MLLRSTLGVLGVLGVAVLAVGAQACSDDDAASPGTGTSSSSSSGGASDAGDGGNGGDPLVIDTPANEWKFVPFADSTCANGKPTGLGINKGTSKRVVIFLEGGGACWTKKTCNNDPVPVVANIKDGFDEAKFTSTAAKFGGGLFDRALPGNPYKDASFVYVPYCTGDVHSGDKEGDYEGEKVQHRGRRNIEAYLKRLVPTFKDAERVTLSGSSAGGFGAALNYDRVAKAFGTVRVDLVDDSGPPMTATTLKNFGTWAPAWDLAGGFDAACVGCAEDPTKIIPYYTAKYPTARFTFLSYSEDSTIRTFAEYPGQMPPNNFTAALKNEVAPQFNSANARFFYLPGEAHTMLRTIDPPVNGEGVDAPAVVGADGTPLTTFLTKMDTDDATWASVKLAGQE